jgi:DNA gyrase inhibitor GyrI
VGLRPAGAGETTIAGGRYAVTVFRDTGARIGAAWDAFAAACAAIHAVDPCRLRFEHYPRGAATDAKTGEFVCELCLPVSS